MTEYSQIFASANEPYYAHTLEMNPCSHLHPAMERESILDLSKYLDRSVRVELSGGRKGNYFD